MTTEYNSTHYGAEIDSAVTKVLATSGSWDSIVTDVNSKSGSWEDTTTDLTSKSGSWEDLETYTASLDWNMNSQSVVYEDDLITDDEYCGTIVKKTAGEDVSFGDICYMNSTEKLMKAQASSSEKMPGLYLAVESISTDAVGSFLRRGWASSTDWSGFTAGELIYIESGSTNGVITNTAATDTGANVQIVGIAAESNRIDFDPSLVLVELS